MTKDITTGIALTIIIIAISFAVPIIGFFFVVLIPLPIMFYRTRLGRKDAAVIPVSVIIVMMLITGGITFDVLFLTALFILGFGLGEWLEMSAPLEKCVFYPNLAVWVASSILVFFYNLVSDVNVAVRLSDFVAANLNHTLMLYKEMGIPEETVQMLERSMPRIQYVLVRIVPGIVMAGTLFISWVNVLAAKSLYAMKGMRFPDFGPFNRWKSPEMLIWVVVAAGIMLVIPDSRITLFGMNALLVLFVIYFLHGIAIVSFFFEKKKLPVMLKTVLYLLIVFQQIFLLFIAGIGFFDAWLDVRKLKAVETVD
ncbi:MAG: YybS family protein [Desulfobacterales bacterium]